VELTKISHFAIFGLPHGLASSLFGDRVIGRISIFGKPVQTIASLETGAGRARRSARAA
jgi:hypothetical protein